jgi:hypothetical protein
MTKMIFGITAVVVSLIYATVALCNHALAQDIGIVYIAVFITLLVLAHGKETNGHA